MEPQGSHPQAPRLRPGPGPIRRVAEPARPGPADRRGGEVGGPPPPPARRRRRPSAAARGRGRFRRPSIPFRIAGREGPARRRPGDPGIRNPGAGKWASSRAKATVNTRRRAPRRTLGGATPGSGSLRLPAEVEDAGKCPKALSERALRAGLSKHSQRSAAQAF